MKLLKNATYRALKADEHNTGLLVDKYKRLESEFKRVSGNNQLLKSELNRLGNELVEAKRRLKKYNRQRGEHGRFVKEYN